MRILCTATLAVIFAAWPAYAQERAGAGRLDVSVIPAGAVFFADSSSEGEPAFGNYTVAAAAGWNFTRWIAVEGEVGTALGVKQELQFNGEMFGNQRSPHFLAYNANAVFNPVGSDRTVVPYLTGGVGGLRMVETDEVARLGIRAPTNFLTGNLGGGVKWYAQRHWGARADYRLMIVNDNADAPGFFGREEVRYGHRIYGALLLTY